VRFFILRVFQFGAVKEIGDRRCVVGFGKEVIGYMANMTASVFSVKRENGKGVV
jgi:hypothetical protein